MATSKITIKASIKINWCTSLIQLLWRCEYQIQQEIALIGICAPVRIHTAPGRLKPEWSLSGVDQRLYELAYDPITSMLEMAKTRWEASMILVKGWLLYPCVSDCHMLQTHLQQAIGFASNFRKHTCYKLEFAVHQFVLRWEQWDSRGEPLEKKVFLFFMQHLTTMSQPSKNSATSFAIMSKLAAASLLIASSWTCSLLFIPQCKASILHGGTLKSMNPVNSSLLS